MAEEHLLKLPAARRCLLTWRLLHQVRTHMTNGRSAVLLD